MEIDRGWYRCRHCASLVNGAGGCVSGGIHDLSTSPLFKAPVGTIDGVGEPGWGACTQCAALSWKLVPGVCTAGPGQHVFQEFSAEYYILRTPAFGALDGWRKCFNCGHLFDSNAPGAQCIAGGQHDQGGNPVDYSVPMVMAALADNWYWCNKCQGLSRMWGNGVCADRTMHNSDTMFKIAFGDLPAGAQAGWALCNRCLMLVFTGNGVGACFAGPGGHDVTRSLAYRVPMDIEPVDQQAGWRACSKCQTLTYTEFSGAPCPAGDEHDHAASGRYSLLPSSLRDGYPGWRLCVKCRCITQTAVSPGRCRDGGPHDHAGSKAYVVNEGATLAGGDSSWYWCSRCQGLSHGTFTEDGICVDSTKHEHRDSWVHGVHRDEIPANAQTGWRMCAVCKQLTLPNDDGTTGLCVNGALHDLTGSPELALVTYDPPPLEQQTRPTLALTESETMVVVDGTAFSANVSVDVTFVPKPVVTVFTDEAGAFHLEQSPVVPAPAAGGYVLAKESPLEFASAKLTQFVPATA